MKQGEVDYLRKLGEEGAVGAFNKPFSHSTCPKNLVDMGLILSLLPAPPAQVLDLGCGTGWTSWFLAKSGYDVVGQDIADDMIRYARQNAVRYGVDNASFVVSDYESLEYMGKFDAALFYDALHHAEDEAAAIRCAYRALKPGGVLITHEPGRGHSRSPEAVHAIEAFGVTEKDMPPSRIFDLGRAAGFIDCSRAVDPTLLMLAVYGVNLSNRARPIGLLGRLKRWLSLGRAAANAEIGAICILRKP